MVDMASKVEQKHIEELMVIAQPAPILPRTQPSMQSLFCQSISFPKKVALDRLWPSLFVMNWTWTEDQISTWPASLARIWKRRYVEPHKTNPSFPNLDQAEQLMVENLSKNLSDADEYPAMMDIHARCVSIIANMWHVQKGERAIGTATTGSSEAIHLGGLALKQRWKENRQSKGLDTSKPNILMGSNAQVALEKFARYFDVEARILPVSSKSRNVLDPELVRQNVDENTIGVFVILGSTYTGVYENVSRVNEVLDEYEKETGHYVPIHVDAASGGFIAPFTDASQNLDWDFKIPRVHSINVSGHKFGLVYAGVGWIIWRDEQYLPKHLIFELHYLGGTEQSYTLNFSRPGAQVIGQYYNLIHLGFNGYREIMENTLSNARLLSNALESTGWYRCVSDIHRKKGVFQYAAREAAFQGGESSEAYNAGLPVVAFTLTDDFKKKNPHVKQAAVSTLLRAKQYIIPSKSQVPSLPSRVASPESASPFINKQHFLVADKLANHDKRLPLASERREDGDSSCGSARVHVT
jgi:glutamate decarboxylase